MSNATYLIDRIFPAYEVHLTGGASGSGKTTLEFQLLEEWRNHRRVFGYQSHPVPFCYVACDRSLNSIHETVERIGLNVADFPIISLINKNIGRNFTNIVAAARQMVTDLGMIYLDGIHSICPGGKINDYDTVQRFLVEMTRVCQRDKLTVRGIGHATKAREGEGFLNPRHRFLGTVAWGGFSDTMTIIDAVKPEDPTDTTRHVYLLPRNESNQLLTYEIKGGRLSLLGNNEPNEFQLDLWLAKQPSQTIFTASDIQEMGLSLKVSRATVFRWIKTMVEAGKLLRTDRGTYMVRPKQ